MFPKMLENLNTLLSQLCTNYLVWLLKYFIFESITEMVGSRLPRVWVCVHIVTFLTCKQVNFGA